MIQMRFAWLLLLAACAPSSNIPESEVDVTDAAKADGTGIPLGVWQGSAKISGALTTLILDDTDHYSAEEFVCASCDPRALMGTYQLTVGVQTGDHYLRLDESGRTIRRYRYQLRQSS